MKKILLLLISSIVAFASVGKITAIKGEVYIDRQSKQIPARVGSSLELKDKISTKEKSKALILFNDKTSITVGKNSTLEVEKYVFTPTVASNNEAQFKFGQGVFRTLTGKIGKLNKKKFKIKTATASIGIRGTVFDVEVAADGKTLVGVLDGKVVAVINGKELNLNPGQVVKYDDETGEVTTAKGTLESTKELNKDSKELDTSTKNKSDENKKQEKKSTKKEKSNTSNSDDSTSKEKAPLKEETIESETELPFSSEESSEPEPLAPISPKEPTENITDIISETNEKTDSANDEADDAKEKSSINATPVFTISGIQSINEDSSLIFKAIDSDSTDTLEYSIVSSSTNGELFIENGEIIYIPKGDFSGSDSFTISVSDGKDIVSKTIDVEINPINDAPVVEVIDTVTINEDTRGQITFTVSDIDSEVLKTSITNKSTNAEISIVDGEISYIPNENFNGEDSFEITTTDENGGSTVKTVTITVNPINDDPTISISDTSTLKIKQSESANISFSTNDIDNDSVTVSAIAVNGTVSIVNGEVVYQANTEFTGTDTITITYTDGTVIKTETFTLIVQDYISVSNPGESTPTLNDELENITKEVMSDSSDTYMEYGYVLESVEGEQTRVATYITGDLTPSEKIAQYITNKNTASYSGGVAALVNGVSSDGSVNLNIDFGAQNYTGQLNITQGNWQAVINSGSVHQYGFGSSDISTATGSSVQNITGNMSGKFYGPEANSVGGTFNLTSPTGGSASGVFGGNK